MLDGLLVGFTLCASLAVSLFFLKFWRATKDQLFLAFALVFAIEGSSRLVGLFVDIPNDRAPLVYLLRLAGYGILIVSIVAKNRSRPRE